MGLSYSDRENLFKIFSKFSRKLVEKKSTSDINDSFGGSGTSGKSRATRCQNSSLPRRWATPNTWKKRFGKNSHFFVLGKQVFVIFEGQGQHVRKAMGSMSQRTFVITDHGHLRLRNIVQAIVKTFAKIRSQKFILPIIRTRRTLGEVENYALSKTQL